MNCDKAIKKEHTYGEPYALKLEILMIDISRVREEKGKSIVWEEIEDLLFLINSIESPLLKGYFLERLITDQSVSYLEKYIKAINKEFAIELAPIRENVLKALYENYSIATEREKELMKDILSQGLNSNPNIDGLWEADFYQNAGIEIDLTGASITLELLGSTFNLNLMNVRSEGLAYYLPDVQPYTINLMWADAESKFKTFRGIYQVDNPDKITLCISEPDQLRPSEFISNLTNGFSVIVFNKIVKDDI